MSRGHLIQELFFFPQVALHLFSINGVSTIQYGIHTDIRYVNRRAPRCTRLNLTSRCDPNSSSRIQEMIS